MRRILRTTLALITVAVMPLVAIAPASATSPDLSSFTFDCDTFEHDPFPLVVPIYESDVVVNFENCPDTYLLNDGASTGNASVAAVTVDSFQSVSIGSMTVTAPTTIEIWAPGWNYVATLYFRDPTALTNPDGVQLVADASQEIPAAAPAAVWGTRSEIDAEEPISIGGISGCNLMPGEHVYASQSFTVSTAGDYTFRVTGIDPVSQRLTDPFTLGDELGLEDPMVALYSTFNTLDPSSDILGCNDDIAAFDFGGALFVDNLYFETDQGDYIHRSFSYFSTTLDPGDYMLVFTTFDGKSTEDWGANNPAGSTVHFDVWGPDDGLDLTDVDPIAVDPSADPKSLAATGVDPTFALWSALTLVGMGAALTVARRRRERV
jgi:hypothetical protein